MYLSLLKLNLRSRQVQSELASPYEMHRTIMQAFPNGQKRDTAGVLFRLDMDARSGQPVLLVQSQIEPNWHVLKSEYLAPDDGPAPQVKDFEIKVRAGQDLAFRLRANPTVKRNDKRCGLYREEEQQNWLIRKGAEHGFRVLQVSISHTDVAEGVIHRETQTHDLTLLSVRFDGVLQVLDSTLLRAAVAGGIGSGKAFGFGLLSLARSTLV
jgi:CRISPR system Cascade subunit CasE